MMTEIMETQEHFDKIKLSKLNRNLVRLFLISDIKNPKLWPELRQIKKDIVRNFNGSTIKSEYINRLFRAYNEIGKDIYIPFYLKKYIPKFNVQMEYDNKVKNINLKEYLAILKDIRFSLMYLKKLQSEIQSSTGFDPKQQIRTEGERSIAAEQQGKYIGLYQEKINSEIVEIQEKISGGSFSLTDIVQLYVFSLSLDKKAGFSFKKYLTEEHMRKEFVLGDLKITLKDFIRILKDLKIENHKLN